MGFYGNYNSITVGTIAAYFNEVSNGLYTMNGSNVFGWYQLPYTRNDVETLAARTPIQKQDGFNGFNPVPELHNLHRFATIKALCIQVLYR